MTSKFNLNQIIMKKLFLFLMFVFTLSTYSVSAFVPDEDIGYNKEQASSMQSMFVINDLNSQDVLMFEFQTCIYSKQHLKLFYVLNEASMKYFYRPEITKKGIGLIKNIREASSRGNPYIRNCRKIPK